MSKILESNFYCASAVIRIISLNYSPLCVEYG